MMNIVKYPIVLLMLLVLITAGITGSCSANGRKDTKSQELLLIVADHSNETYGEELKKEVFTQLQNKLQVSVSKHSNEARTATWVEKPELLELTNQTGVNQVVVVEILPIKSDFSDILFYKAIRSEATLRIRLYDAVKSRYIVTQEVQGTARNITYIPYTSVGKKATVSEAVRKATEAAAQTINQSEADVVE
ncbi:hypothetical protein [Anaerospora sp.]|uniref:hypothetical protein n=1 Tax=Anaerospora sp. TaxID=1960278 RepID=UPI0028994084|nr:hypothetical protein [Anaerospora sp.]